MKAKKKIKREKGKWGFRERNRESVCDTDMYYMCVYIDIYIYIYDISEAGSHFFFRCFWYEKVCRERGQFL